MSTEENDLITVDPLFVGLTRPSTLFGIPYMAAVSEFMFTAIFFLGHGNPISVLMIIPLHAVLYAVSAADPNVFNSIALWSKTNALCQNRMYWKVTSFSPLSENKRDNIL